MISIVQALQSLLDLAPAVATIVTGHHLLSVHFLFILSAEEILRQAFPSHLQIGGNVGEDRAQGSDPQVSVAGNGNVVFSTFGCGSKPQVASRLSRDLVSVAAKGSGELCPGEVPRELQAGMTSSLTR